MVISPYDVRSNNKEAQLETSQSNATRGISSANGNIYILRAGSRTLRNITSMKWYSVNNPDAKSDGAFDLRKI